MTEAWKALADGLGADLEDARQSEINLLCDLAEAKAEIKALKRERDCAWQLFMQADKMLCKHGIHELELVLRLADEGSKDD